MTWAPLIAFIKSGSAETEICWQAYLEARLEASLNLLPQIVNRAFGYTEESARRCERASIPVPTVKTDDGRMWPHFYTAVSEASEYITKSVSGRMQLCWPHHSDREVLAIGVQKISVTFAESDSGADGVLGCAWTWSRDSRRTRSLVVHPRVLET